MSLSRMLDKLNVSLPTPLGKEIQLVIHWSWLLMVTLIAIQGDWKSVGLVLGAYVIVILHEFGHCFAARYYNIPMGNILILPFGGCAQIDMPTPSPKVEWVVTACGPLVNFALTPIFLTAVGAATLAGYQTTSDYLMSLLILNTFIMVFNLLPAFPMDGGRMLRATLHRFWGDMQRATLVSARISQVVSVVGALVALYYGLYISMLLAFFIGMGSQAELFRVRKLLGLVKDDESDAEPPKVEVRFISWMPPEESKTA